MVVFFSTMVQRIDPYNKSKANHEQFKTLIFNDIDANKGQAAQNKGQNGAVNGTGHRCCNAKSVPVDFELHGYKDNLLQHSCKT